MKSKILKIWEKLKAVLKQGLTPKQLSLSIVIAILVSFFPIFGISTIVLTSVALPLRLNLPIMIALSYALEPLKYLVVIPFINIGARVFGAEHTLLSFEAIKASYDISFFDTVKALSYELLCGFAGWTITAIPIGVLLYFTLKGILTYYEKPKNTLTEL